MAVLATQMLSRHLRSGSPPFTLTKVEISLQVRNRPPVLMWFWRDTYFQTLQDVAAEASTSPEWADYAAYCTEHERGLRHRAFAILDGFISRMECASFAERRKFASWLLHRADLCDGSHILVPYPLRKRVIESTLAEWLQVDPASSEPYRWLGGYDHLKRAIELDPSDEVARRKFIEYILGSVDYATHELPCGYLGEPRTDLEVLAEAEAALRELSSEEDRRSAAAEIGKHRALIEDYLHRR